MKKSLLLLALSLVVLQGTAQESAFNQLPEHRDIAKNELSLNAFNVLIFGVLDGTYERIISEQGSISIGVFADVFDKREGENVDFSEVYTKDFAITTTYKFFFSEDRIARGFYAEGFGMLSSGTTEETREIPSQTGSFEDVEIDYTDFALGLGIGGKFVAKKGFMIDVSFGIGRNLFNNDSPVLVILPSANVGYRF